MPDVMQFLMVSTVAFLLAGTIKGVAGLGLPTAAIGLLTLFVAPRMAIAVILIPMITANAWQVWRAGDILPAIRRYAPLSIMLAIFVWATTMVSADVPDRIIVGVTGVVILLFVTVNLSLTLPRLPDRYDRTAQVATGAVAGILGGLTGVWAAPMVMYLTARQAQKDEFVRATGLLIFAGSVPLTIGYVQHGFMTWPLAGVSALMVIPTLAGFTLGERLRRVMPQAQFRNVFLVIFALLGLNLIRRAVTGG